MDLISWILSRMRPYRGRMTVLAVLALAQIVLGVLSPWPLKLVVDNVLGGAAASSWPVRTDPCAGGRRLRGAADRDRRGRPAVAARLSGRIDGGHAGAGRHRAADGLFAAREAARAPAGAGPSSPHRDAHGRFGVPPRGRRVLRARPGDERRAAAARRRADPGRDVRRPAEAECIPGTSVAGGRAVSLRQPSVLFAPHDRSGRAREGARVEADRAALRDSLVDQSRQELRARAARARTVFAVGR